MQILSIETSRWLAQNYRLEKGLRSLVNITQIRCSQQHAKQKRELALKIQTSSYDWYLRTGYKWLLKNSSCQCVCWKRTETGNNKSAMPRSIICGSNDEFLSNRAMVQKSSELHHFPGEKGRKLSNTFFKEDISIMVKMNNFYNSRVA